MNDKKRCIVNFFSQGREPYGKGSERLVATLVNNNVDADIIIWSPDFNEETEQLLPNNNTLKIIKGMPVTTLLGECKPHSDQKYQFKSFCIQAAKEMGYEKIAWMDSSIMVFDDIEHLWKLTSQVGVVTFDNPGCPEATWTSDDCLEAMGCDKDYAKTFFQIDAAMLFFDFTFFKTQELFNDYLKYSTDGICLNGVSESSRENFNGHRHDQSILSYLIRKHLMYPLNYGVWCYGGDDNMKNFNPSMAKVGIPR